jgi:hypothetical protein
MNYTKGEWQYWPDTGEIKSALLKNNGFVKVCDVTVQDSPERLLVNARLIAAAPRLYEALKEIYEGDADHVPSDEVWERAKKAIAKAEGKK